MRLKLTTAVTVLALAAAGGVAAATVVVYSNDFSSRTKFRSVQKFDGGKQCRKFWRNRKTFGVEVKKGPLQCDFRTPVSGDSKGPDHELDATATVLKSTANAARRLAYVGVAVRADESSRYELRVYPHTRQWEVRRRPDNAEFPLRGTNQGIAPINKRNRLRLRAFGNRVTATVNDATVVPGIADPDPGDLNGRKTLLVAGSGGNSGKSAEASFREVRVRLP
jgi:hypothetical protein